jgi:hypothetical protein
METTLLLPETTTENINFTVYQETTSLELSMPISNDKNKTIGTLLNELFSWIKLQKAMRADGLKLSQPLNIRLTFNGATIDTGNVRKELQQKLRCNSTAKGMRNFAGKLVILIDYIVRTPELMTIEQALENLDK